MQSRLKISNTYFRVEVQGDETFVADAYRALRHMLLDYVETSFVDPAPAHIPSVPEVLPEGPGRQAIWLQICHDLYRRVYAIERASLQKATLFQRIDLAELTGVYVERAARDRIERVITLGKPLWSQLTPRGAATAALPSE